MWVLGQGQKRSKNMKIHKKEEKRLKMAGFRTLKFPVLLQFCPRLYFIGSRMGDFAKKSSQKAPFLETFGF